MEEITNERINKAFGIIFQEYRLKNKITQEKFAEQMSKSTKTISQIETGKDGTSKKTDIDFMNSLGIMPNTLYKQFITNPELVKKMEMDEQVNRKISNWKEDKIECLFKILDAIDKL